MWTLRYPIVVSVLRTCIVCAADGLARSSPHAPHLHSHKSMTQLPTNNPIPSRAKRSIPSASATKSSAPLSESAPTPDQASHSAIAWASDLKAIHVGDQIVKPAPAGEKITVRAASRPMGTSTPTVASPMAALRKSVAIIHTVCFRSPRESKARMRRSCCARRVRCMSR